MTLPRSLLFGLALLAPCAAVAEPAADAPPASGFEGLWTGWGDVNREALQREQAEEERVRRDLATADARRLQALREHGRPLGERVGEIVREGNCEEGERVARDAGDFALVEAVRAHCRAIPASARQPQP